MKRVNLLILIIFAYLPIYASIIEIKEPAILEVSFLKECNLDTNDRVQPKMFPGDMALRVGKTSAMFYPPKSLWYDSLSTANHELANKIYYDANPPGSKTYVAVGGYEHEYIFRNIHEGETMVYGRMAGEASCYKEPTELPEWTVGTETKEVLGYECIKATASYRGREWTAWFTPEIPISEGPWKLAGLPGLVLEAYDRHSDYRFVATGIKTENIQPVGIYIYSSSKPFYYKSRKKVLARQFREDLQGEFVYKMRQAYGKPGSANEPHRSKYDFLETDYPHEE